VSPFGLEVAQDNYCVSFCVRGEVHFVLGACHAVHLLLLRACSYVNNTVNQVIGRGGDTVLRYGLD
jgi:hypothetical protein